MSKNGLLNFAGGLASVYLAKSKQDDRDAERAAIYKHWGIDLPKRQSPLEKSIAWAKDKFSDKPAASPVATAPALPADTPAAPVAAAPVAAAPMDAPAAPVDAPVAAPAADMPPDDQAAPAAPVAAAPAMSEAEQFDAGWNKDGSPPNEPPADNVSSQTDEFNRMNMA